MQFRLRPAPHLTCGSIRVRSVTSTHYPIAFVATCDSCFVYSLAPCRPADLSRCHLSQRRGRACGQAASPPSHRALAALRSQSSGDCSRSRRLYHDSNLMPQIVPSDVERHGRWTRAHATAVVWPVRRVPWTQLGLVSIRHQGTR